MIKKILSAFGVLFIIIFFVLISLGFGINAFAQTGSNAGDSQYSVPALPGLKDYRYKDGLIPEPFPSGENQSGKVWGWHFSTQRFSLDFPKIFLGVGALSSNVSLTQNTFTHLDTAIGSFGFRGGLAQYTPQGTFYLTGQVTFATGVTSSSYEIQVTQGTLESDPVSQPHIYVGSPIVIGGGYCSSPGVSNIPFQCTFISPKFQCVAPFGWACEIRVSVFTSDASGASPTALSSGPNIGSTHVSNVIVVRAGNLDSTQ